MNKTCSICGESKDIEQFNIYRQYKGEPKRRSYCKACQAERDSLRYEDRKNSGHRVSEKFCPMCERTLPYTEFGKNKGSSTGLKTYCKECTRKLDRVYKIKDSYMASHRKGELNRYHTMRSGVSDFTEEQWQEALRYFDNKCAYCGCELTEPTKDHFVSVKNGGGYTVDNIVPACRSCNGSKCDTYFEIWAMEKDLPQEVIEKIYDYFVKVTPSQTLEEGEV